MAFLRRIIKKSSPKSKPSSAADPSAMATVPATTEEKLAQQTAGISLVDDKYNPDTVDYEVATFALS